ncbi:hypothetical protein RDWZM_007907 [Blomia tropicalis]|uniref:Uncharacterized protein n=1 Tax=Blomia tropicalis TaxID=40697 RepID=A0A9Q0LZZ5_BLOTA|nr:hypothetical protein RDWZM_007907 [Blomia tropicalis]
MSGDDDDSGVDSENENASNGQPLAIMPNVLYPNASMVIAADLDISHIPPIIVEQNQQMNNAIEIDHNDDEDIQETRSSEIMTMDNNDEHMKSSNDEIASSSSKIVTKFNDNTQLDLMNERKMNIIGPSFSADSTSQRQSTSSDSTQMIGLNLRIDDETMSDLHSFYQNQIVQHDLNPKMMKNRKHRYEHYEHLIAEKRLRNAANSNDYSTVVRVLQCGVNVNACDERKRTALHFAACHGNFAIAFLLLDHGANPNQQDVIGNTPLHLAVCSSKLDLVILLLKNGANCNASDNSGRTPIQLAKSKLSIISQSLQSNKDQQIPMINYRLESMKISIMLKIYFENMTIENKKNEEKKTEIDIIKERLESHETNEDVEKDVNDLLKCLNDWSI